MSTAADGFIKVNPDSTDPAGKNVDTTVITRDDGTIVYRERDVIADAADAAVIANVRNKEVVETDVGIAIREVHGPDYVDLQTQILAELRSIRFVLQSMWTEDGTNNSKDSDPTSLTDQNGTDLTL